MQQGKEVLTRTKVVTTKRRSQPKTEVVTQNFSSRRERRRGCDMRLRLRHQFLRTTEPKRLRPKLRSRPLVNEAVRNEVVTKENLVTTELEQIKRTQVSTSIQGRDINPRSRHETVIWAFLLRIPLGVFFGDSTQFLLTVVNRQS